MRHSIFSHPLVTLILAPCVQEMQITTAVPQANWRPAARAWHSVSEPLQLSMSVTLAPGTFQTSVHLKPQLRFHIHTVKWGRQRQQRETALPTQDIGWYPCPKCSNLLHLCIFICLTIMCDLTSLSWFRSLSFLWSLGSIACKCIGCPLFPCHRWVRMENDTLLAPCQVEHSALWLGEWEWGMAGGKPTLGKWWLFGMGWALTNAKDAELKSHSCWVLVKM